MIGVAGSHAKKPQIILIHGPMMAGKTREGMRMMRLYTIVGLKGLVVKFGEDLRFSADGTRLMTHDKEEMAAVSACKLADVPQVEVARADVIFVDEGQFYPDLVWACRKWTLEGKIVIVSALDSDFKMGAFEQVSALLPHADVKVHLTAICKGCHNPAAFSMRTTAEKELKVIGGAEKYQPACRACHKVME